MATATDASLPPEKLDALLVVIDDARCEVIEAQKLISAAMTGPAQAVANPPDTGVPAQLEEVLALLARPARQPARHAWQWVAGGLLAGVLCVGVGWTAARWGSGRVAREAAFMRAMDTVLVERYQSFPPAAQQSITSVYKQYDFQEPGQRKRGSK